MKPAFSVIFFSLFTLAATAKTTLPVVGLPILPPPKPVVGLPILPPPQPVVGLPILPPPQPKPVTGKAAVSQLSKSRACQGFCENSPQDSSGFSFQGAQDIFEEARIPTESELLGEWMIVAQADKGDHEKSLENLGSFYLPSGLNAKDGSKSRLRFALENSFDERQALSMRILGTAFPNISPVKVEIQDNGACFAEPTVWPNGYVNGELDYLSLECRLVKANNKKMICKVTLHFFDDFYKSDSGKFFFQGFTKM